MHGAQPWGFHQLRADWAQRVVEAAPLKAGQLVVDLGAGLGGLTLPLLDRGVEVIAVEKHVGRAEALRRRVGDRDATVLTADLVAFRFPRRPVRVVANPPFALAAELLAALVACPQLVTADLVLPRWRTQRHVGSDRFRRGFLAREGLSLPRSAFQPSAPTGCSVLQLRRVRPPRRPAARRQRRTT